MNLTLQTAAVSDQGLVRRSNQDVYLHEKDLGLFAVADGMGGNAGGEVASRYAAKLIQSALSSCEEKDLESLKKWWEKKIRQVCLRIYEYALENPQYRGMGTTLSLVHHVKQGKKSQILISHVGDSRVYWMRKGFLYQITQDHSLVSEKIRSGLLKPDDPLIKKIKNILTRSVGYQEDEEVDVFSVDPQPEDGFLVCSDGLHNKVEEEDLQKALEAVSDEVSLQRNCENLVELAKKKGGEDNITVVMGKFGK